MPRPPRDIATFAGLLRKNRSSTLLRQLSILSATDAGQPVLTRAEKGSSPWAISEVAKMSVVVSNEHIRDRPISQDGVRMLCSYFVNLEGVHSGETDQEVGKRSLLQLGFEQFRYQRDMLEGLGRSLAILVDVPRRHEDLRRHSDIGHSAFGGELLNAAKFAWVTYLALTQAGGSLSKADTESGVLKEVFERLKIESTQSLFLELSQTMEEAKATFRESSGGDLLSLRWAPNLLELKPFVQIGEDSLVAPELSNLLLAMSFENVLKRAYFRNRLAYDSGLGPLVERYASDLIHQVKGAKVAPEFEYRVSRHEVKKTIDFFVELNSLNLFVEVKSVRPDLALRQGLGDLDSAYDSKFQEAVMQLDWSYRKWLEGATGFPEMTPAGRSIGLVVTAESFHLANASLYRSGKISSLPIFCCSLDELERLVMMPIHQIEAALEKLLDDEELASWDFRNSIPGIANQASRNPLVEAAINAIISK